MVSRQALNAGDGVEHRKHLARSGWWWNRLKTTEVFGNGFRHGDAAVGQDVLILLLDGVAQPIEPAGAHHELQPGFVLVLAVAVDVEHADHGFHAADDFLGGKELVEELGFDGQRSQTAGHGHAEAVHSVADHRAQADVVDRGRDAILGAAGKRDLELARQAIGQLLVQERQRQPPGVRLHIEGLFGMDAGQRARRDVADGVVAGFASGESNVG